MIISFFINVLDMRYSSVINERIEKFPSKSSKILIDSSSKSLDIFSSISSRKRLSSYAICLHSLSSLCTLFELHALIRSNSTNEWATIFVQIRKLQICFTFVLLLSFLSRVFRERIARTFSSTLLKLSFFKRDVFCWVSSFLCFVDWFCWTSRWIRFLLSHNNEIFSFVVLIIFFFQFRSKIVWHLHKRDDV
jgi:hypothetical protein